MVPKEYFYSILNHINKFGGNKNKCLVGENNRPVCECA
jgi:hypothetical protein